MGKKNDKAKPVEPPAAQPDAQVASPVPVPPATPIPAAPTPPAKATVKKPAAKKVVKKVVKKSAAKKAASKKPAISTEDISLRAYFISEHRHKHGLHGDSHTDWVEAERQLKAELKKKTAKAAPKKAKK